jgi:hypothetical protein
VVPDEKLTVNPEAARRYLTEITRGWDALGEPVVLELRCIMPKRTPNVARFNPTPEGFEELIQHAMAMNATKLNCYVIVNPVRASAPMNRDGRQSGATDEDIVAAFFYWADGDDEDAANSIRSFAGPKHTMAVMTGTIPTPRPHIYWRIADGPTRDLATWTGVQKSIAAKLSTDHTVVNPSRIMRLPGTINWPTEKKALKGRVPEVTTFRTQYDDARQPVTVEQMARIFPPIIETVVGGDGTFTMDAGFAPSMDRETARIKALSGEQWNIEVFRLVGSYVRKGLEDHEIHTLTDPLTLTGYTVADTRAEVQNMIDRTRANPKFQDEPARFDPAAAIQATPLQQSPSIEWFRDITPALTDSYIVKGVIGSDTMSVIYGPSNSGKTFFTLDLAFHIAAGINWRGLRVNRAGVLYLAAEGGKGVANRIAALKIEKGVQDVPLALRRAGLDLLKQEADLQIVYALANEVKAASGGGKILIVIDTLSRVMAGGDENSASDMTALIRNIDAIREATNSHIMLVHHSGKDVARGARGHSSLRAATDTEIEVQNEDGNRAAIVTKQRDYQGGETFAFDLKAVPLGIDQDGDEVSSCVVEAADSGEFQAAKKAAKGRGKNQQIIMDTFDQMVSEGLAQPNPGGVGMPEAGQFWAVDADQLRQLSQSKMVGDRPAALFRQAWTALTEAGGVFVTGHKLAWRVDRRRK